MLAGHRDRHGCLQRDAGVLAAHLRPLTSQGARRAADRYFPYMLWAALMARRLPPSIRSESGGGRESPRLPSAIRFLSNDVHPRPLASAVLILGDL